MKQYMVTGMTCAACSARVTKAVEKVEGVDSCAVSLLTNSMGVEGDAAPDKIIQAVKAAGYNAVIVDKNVREKNAGDLSTKNQTELQMLEDHETPLLKKRLFSSLILLVVLMYFSMGHMMFSFPIPSFFSGNHVAMGLLQLLLTTAIMVINQHFFVNGYKSLFHLSPNMDTLVALGASAAYGYSTVILFAMTKAQQLGQSPLIEKYMNEFYFESAAMILTLITVGKMLEARSKGKTTDALKGLIKLSPKKATIIQNGVEQQIPIENLKKDQIFIVKPGENIPVDGIVVEGDSAINEAALTGESIPVDKQKGDEVWAATTNVSGYLKCRATRVGEDTTLAQIIKLVSDAAATKAPIAKIADVVSGVFVPTVIALAIITIVVWLFVSKSVGFALARGISVLVISCPCALGLATPVAIMVGNGVGAKNGIMFKTAQALELTGKIDIVCLDKTGTLTKGEPCITDIWTAKGIDKTQLMAAALALEIKSEHPLAKAITAYGSENNLEIEEVEAFKIYAGNGLSGKQQGVEIAGGNKAFIWDKLSEQEKKSQSDIDQQEENFAIDGKTPLFFEKGGQLLGIIAVSDVIKEDSCEAVKQLENMGITVVMLTGDNEKTAQAIGKTVGVNQVVAKVRPEGKEKIISTMQKKGKVAMVGDGINDAPALTRADVGIAIGAGADVAIDAADVVLMKNSLLDVAASIRLSRSTIKNIHENLFWAFFYNAIGIPLAAGCFIHLLGWELNPMFGAAAMSLSSFCVVTNALRLNFIRIHDSSKDHAVKKKHINIEKKKKQVKIEEDDNIYANKKIEEKNIEEKNKYDKKENSKMKKEMIIEGMMCQHCEARVKKALQEIEQVEAAEVSHEKGNAIVVLKGEVSDEILKKAVEDQDYKVISVK